MITKKRRALYPEHPALPVAPAVGSLLDEVGQCDSGLRHLQAVKPSRLMRSAL
jgi:hypothetical protein